MNDTAGATQNQTVLSRTWVWLIIAVSLVPTLFALAGTRIGMLSTTGAPWMDPAGTADLVGPFMYTIAQVSGFCIAFFAAMLCFTHFAHTGEVTTPILGVGLVCAAAIDIWQMLAADFLLPIQTAPELFIPVTWTLSRGFYALVIIVAVSMFLVSGKVKGQRKRRQALVQTAVAAGVFTAVSGGIIYLCGTQPAFTALIYGSAKSRLIWNLLPLVLFIVAGLYVLPTYYQWHPTVFAQTLILSCVALALGQAHFAFGGGIADWHFVTANVLKVVGYVVPLIGLVLDYEQTYARLDKSNRALQDKLFMFEQSQAVSRQKQQFLETLLEKLPNPVYLLDSSLRVSLMNDANARLLGLKNTFEAVGKSPLQLLSDEAQNREQEHCQTVLKTGETVEGEPASIRYPDGREHHLAWHYSPVRDEDGRVMAVMCIGRKAA